MSEDKEQITAKDLGPTILAAAPIQLKIKQVSLGQEISLIKAQERRLQRRMDRARAKRTSEDTSKTDRRTGLVVSLNLHRQELRAEARATNLARGFLKGRRYGSIESRCDEGNLPPFDRAWEIASKFWEGSNKQALAQVYELWLALAKVHYEENLIPALTHEDELLRCSQRRGRRLLQEQRTPKENAMKCLEYWTGDLTPEKL